MAVSVLTQKQSVPQGNPVDRLLAATAVDMAKVNEQGVIEDYDVVVPTAQNQINIENDLKGYFNENLDKDEETLRVNAESIIRAYDPCMSCATNFLKIDWTRE